MSDILKYKRGIESAIKDAMRLEESDHFWLRIDMQRIYLKEICEYNQSMYKRLTASTIFQNWWIVQCLHIERTLLKEVMENDAAPSKQNYENVARTRLQRRDVKQNYLYIVSQVIKISNKESEIS